MFPLFLDLQFSIDFKAFWKCFGRVLGRFGEGLGRVWGAFGEDLGRSGEGLRKSAEASGLRACRLHTHSNNLLSQSLGKGLPLPYPSPWPRLEELLRGFSQSHAFGGAFWPVFSCSITT